MLSKRDLYKYFLGWERETFSNVAFSNFVFATDTYIENMFRNVFFDVHYVCGEGRKANKREIKINFHIDGCLVKGKQNKVNLSRCLVSGGCGSRFHNTDPRKSIDFLVF